MNYKEPNDYDHTPISQLWILRLLKIDRVRQSFTLSHSFLDLHEWVDKDIKSFDKIEVSKELDRSWNNSKACSHLPHKCAEATANDYLLTRTRIHRCILDNNANISEIIPS